MSGVFSQWQPHYAEHGIATFPVTIVGKDKKPAVSGYLKLGSKVSDQLALKFPHHEAIGLACRRNRIVVLDVDTPDERVLEDGMARHGPTPFVVRSGSGNFQAWYRHNGERRRVRPDPSLPIDILGDGFVVAPPSQGTKGPYEIIHGKLDDLDRLPRMRREPPANENDAPRHQLTEAELPVAGNFLPPSANLELASRRPNNGVRNQTLWRYCMKAARSCARIEELMETAMERNRSEFYEPLSAEEVLKVVASAWGYEVEGKNWFGYGPRVILAADEVDDLAADDPRAFALLSILRRHHAGADDFILSKAMAESIGWSVNTLRAARDALEERGFVECIHRGGQKPNDPPLYRFTKGVKS